MPNNTLEYGSLPSVGVFAVVLWLLYKAVTPNTEPAPMP